MNLISEVRFSLRMLRKTPVVSAIVIATMALAIGANTAIFSLVYAILVRPLPLHQPENLAYIWETDLHNDSPREAASYPDYRDFQDQSRTFSAMAGYTRPELTLTEPRREPMRLQAAAVTHNFFKVIGVQPVLGRPLHASDDQRNAARVAILSDELWSQRYGKDPSVLGKEIRLDSQAYTIVGVMPPALDFPPQTKIYVAILPFLSEFSEVRGMHSVIILGRLAPGRTLTEAQAESTLIARRLEQQYPDDNRGRGVSLEPAGQALVRDVRRGLLVLLGAVVAVLMIACANIAGLLLSRAGARRREISIRTALGAGRFNVIRQLLVESVVLSLIGGAAGMVAGYWILKAMVALAPEGLPRASSIALNLPVLAATSLVSLVCGLLFGLAPALHLSKNGLRQAIAGVGSRTGGNMWRRGGRGALVIGELAIALVLLSGAGLLIRSFVQLLKVEPGFSHTNVLAFQLVLPEGTYPQPSRDVYPSWPKVVSFYDRLMERVNAIPGVESASIGLNSPMASGWTSRMTVTGRPEKDGPQDEVRMRPVLPAYFETIGVPLIRGRYLDKRDSAAAPPVVVINHALLKKYFGAEDAVGKHVTIWGHDLEVVGVVGDVKFMGLSSPSEPAVYPSLYQMPMSNVTLVVRGSGSVAGLAPAIREAIWSVEPDLALDEALTLDQILARSMGSPRFYTMLLGGFALIALLLASIGLYGVISTFVAQRTREIGIRMALGAETGQVLMIVLREAGALAAVGIALGFAGVLSLTQHLSALLFRTDAHDALTLATVAFILAVMALAASLIPARRATRVDPVVALRYE